MVMEQEVNLGIDTEKVAVDKVGCLKCWVCEKSLNYNESNFSAGVVYCKEHFDLLEKPKEEEIPTGEDSLSKPYVTNGVVIPKEHRFAPAQTPLVKEEVKSRANIPAVHNRLEVIGIQKGLFGEDVALTQFKNLEQKREAKERVKSLFAGEMIRSIITPKDIDGNKRLDKLARQDQRDSGSNNSTIERADKFGKKTLDTLSTFPDIITSSYINLLSKEGDIVLDLFCGHNSRATSVLNWQRKYVGFDIHTFPVDFTKKACRDLNFKECEDFWIHQQSSEKIDYPNEHFDFALTCPPYFDIEDYSKIYNEQKVQDLSNMSYEQFLVIYSKCISEGFRTLKKGKYFVIVVGDKHRNGELTSLMLDTIKIAKEKGFILHTIDIYNRKSNIGGDMHYSMFINQLKYFPTIHEYIIVFKKPL